MAGPSIVRITWPEASCWATTITGREPCSPLCTCTCTTGSPSMCGNRSPASALAPSQDIVRHMPSSSILPPASGSRRVSSSAGFGSSTRSAASRAACAESCEGATTSRGRVAASPVPVMAGAGGPAATGARTRRPRELRGSGSRRGGLAADRRGAHRPVPDARASGGVRRPRPGGAQEHELALQPSPTAATRLAAQATDVQPAAALRLDLGRALAQAIERGRDSSRAARGAPAAPWSGPAARRCRRGWPGRTGSRRDDSRSRRTASGSAPGPDRRAARPQECAASVPVRVCCRSCASTSRRRARASVVPTAPTANPVCAAISG